VACRRARCATGNASAWSTGCSATPQAGTGGDGIEVNALHPGAIADSNLSRYYNPAELDALRSSGRYTFKTLAQGAATSVYVATSSRLNGVAGRYFENCQEDTPDDPTAAGTDAAGVAAYALDPEAAERLWAVSEQMNQ
jgi:NAD(P)-dependent dehydrogenase (short-subunit alcohol dehydrogenase family)